MIRHQQLIKTVATLRKPYYRITEVNGEQVMKVINFLLVDDYNECPYNTLVNCSRNLVHVLHSISGVPV